MIRISVIGRLGQDATVNNVNEKTVINFSMAYSEKFKNQQGQDVDKTTWVSCAYWTDKTNVANYLKKRNFDLYGRETRSKNIFKR